jgi:hypothetical protein
MKNRLLLLFSLTIMVLFQQDLFGQRYKPFDIKSPFKKTTYDGVMLKKMKAKRVKEIIFSSEDPEAIKYWNTYTTMNTGGTILFIAGDIGLLAAVVIDIQNINTLNSGSLGVRSNSGLLLGSSAAIVAGAVFYLISYSDLKKSILRYNKYVSLGGTNYFPDQHNYVKQWNILSLKIGF